MHALLSSDERAATSLPPTFTEMAHEMDRQLPRWMRRSHPLIRHELGEYWRLMSVDTAQLLRLYLAQVGVVALTAVFPFLLMLLVPVVIVSIILLPPAAVLFFRSIVRIAMRAASSLAADRQANRFDLKRATPFSMAEILLSKATAAAWREIENIGLVWVAVATLSLPVLIIQYDTQLGLEEQPLLIGLAVAIVRLPLEAAMAGGIGLLVGATTKARTPATVIAACIIGGYFLAINALRLLPMTTPVRLAVELALPVLAPALIAVVCWRLSTLVLDRA
jgi:hypothetical protein